MTSDDLKRTIKARLTDPVALFAHLGLDPPRRDGGGWKARCIWHDERTPSMGVRLRNGELGLWCFGACARGGDVFHLVAAARGLDLVRDFKEVLAAAAALAGVDLGAAPPPPAAPRAAPSPAPPKRVPFEELRALWMAAASVCPPNGTLVTEELQLVLGFLSGRDWWPPRALSDLDIVRVLPLPESYAFPRWWRASWARCWRLAVVGREPDGTPASLHARAVTPPPEGKPKERWPWETEEGYQSVGLLFADPAGLELLRGKPRAGLDGVLITEGLTDFVTASLEVAARRLPFAVLSAVNGSFPALGKVRWPAGLDAFVFTDPDRAGDRYAEQVCDALPAVRVFRWRAAVEQRLARALG